MDSEELMLCKEELDQIEINLENIRKQYQEPTQTKIEKVKFEKHLERIRKLSPHKKILIDPEILKLAEI